jgi:hypothetical protein
MAKYRKIYPLIWDDEKFRNWPGEEAPRRVLDVAAC